MQTIHFRRLANRLNHWRHAASSIFLERPEYGPCGLKHVAKIAMKKRPTVGMLGGRRMPSEAHGAAPAISHTV
jgi:hypothetical protein